MKTMKKMVVLVLSVLMVLGTTMVTSFAADPDYSITVKNGKKDETYNAYKMFDLKVNDPTNPTAYSYTVNSDWSGFTSNAAFTAAFTIDAQGYVTAKDAATSETTWNASSVMSKLGEAAAKYAKDNNITPKATKKATADGDVKLEVGAAGYYVITSSLGTRAMIETTPDASAVTVNEKNSEDTIEKVVKEDSTGAWGETNDAQIGDTINFKSTVKVAPRSVNVVVHDTMTTGLTLTANSIKLYTDADCTTALSTDLYTIKGTPDEGDTFTIEIKDAFAATTTADAYIYITYDAVLTTAAVSATPALVDQTNTTTVTFGDGQETTADTTTTSTHKFNVFKHAKGATANLAGAVFKLKKNGTALKLTKINATNYKVDPNGTESTFTTVDTADIVIWGVDADSDYALEETEPPEGYNKLAADVSVTVGADNSTRVDVENNAGTELPSTGGMGTTILYIIGGVLVVVCGIMLVAKKRTSNK